MNKNDKIKSMPESPSRLAALCGHGTLRLGLLGTVLLWASLPPLNIALLAWIAPLPWLWLARLPVLPGRRPYLALWFSGAVFWTATNHWLRLPHPAILPGWLALSWYLAAFPPLIVGLARVAAKRGISIVVSGPVLWVAADQARAYLWTGFSMSSLCHSQYRHPGIIQIADLCGEFGVTFLMVVVAVCWTRALPLAGSRIAWRYAMLSGLVLAAMLGYGAMRLRSGRSDADPQTLKVALLQGSISSEVKHDRSKLKTVYDHYVELARRAVAQDKDVQLIVWPETMYPDPYLLVGEDFVPTPEMGITAERLRENAKLIFDRIVETIRLFNKPTLLGIASVEFNPPRMKAYNSALLLDATGKPMGRYDKQHRVLFGEFIPGADWFPWLYTITPLTGGIEAGRRAESFMVEGYNLAPNICYETALARVIRRQVKELQDRGAEPDVLVNLTNDSWFRGSSELDLHLACGVFRAVEMRKPLVIAANTGFSAHIDAQGNIVQQSPRGEAAVLIANVSRSPLKSPYLTGGDWLAWLCLAAAGVLTVLGLRDRRAAPSPSADKP